jgi:hypothetical protein
MTSVPLNDEVVDCEVNGDFAFREQARLTDLSSCGQSPNNQSENFMDLQHVCDVSSSDIFISDAGLSCAKIDELIANIGFDDEFEYGYEYVDDNEDDEYHYCNSNYAHDTLPDTKFKEQGPLSALLAEWAVEEKIAQSSLSKLLVILSLFHGNLPRDPRTLLKTPRNYELRQLINKDGQIYGQYYHFGIQNGISTYLRYATVPEAKIRLKFNVDGLPLFKSSSTEFWPILCNITDSVSKPFVVGLYCGKGKPVDVSDFLKDFLTVGMKLKSTVTKIQRNFKLDMKYEPG